VPIADIVLLNKIKEARQLRRPYSTSMVLGRGAVCGSFLGLWLAVQPIFVVGHIL
jgi:hypothetical protein